MLQEEFMLYIRENSLILAISAGIVVLFLLLLILVQVTRTRREVHKICKKIRRYFDVILSEEAPEPEPAAAPEAAQVMECQTEDEWQRQQEKRQAEADAQLLMDVISEVF